ncbi:MAG: sigma-70 family RNA polymerase sigma factor [Planctomycetota bacterium]
MPAPGEITNADRPKGRQEAFLAHFAESQRGLHAYIVALVLDPDAAADILQETNIVLWQKFDQFEEGTNFFAWAREVARLCVLRFRQRSARRIAPLDPMLLESLANRFLDKLAREDNDERDALDVCLKRLSASDRDLILERYHPGASVSRMADRLERSANSVSQSLARIRRVLLECVSNKLRGAAAS